MVRLCGFVQLCGSCSFRGVGVTICCPGPIGTGSEETPRVIYGAEGLISQHSADTKGRLSPARCAQLIANAMAHGVNECWIAKHPVLAIGEFMTTWLLATCQSLVNESVDWSTKSAHNIS